MRTSLPPPARPARAGRGRLEKRFVARAGRALGLGIALLTVFAVVALLIPAEPTPSDRRWSEWMTDIQCPPLEHVALAFNDAGRGLTRGLTLAAVGLVLLLARRWLALIAFAVAESLTPLASSAIKALVGRPRPPGGLVHPAGASFPSGHAAYASVTLVALVLLFTTPGPRRRPWWTLAILGIAGMAWSRTYLQVHWLSDVLAGSVLGVAVTLLAFAAAQGRR